MGVWFMSVGHLNLSAKKMKGSIPDFITHLQKNRKLQILELTDKSQKDT